MGYIYDCLREISKIFASNQEFLARAIGRGQFNSLWVCYGEGPL